MTTDNPTPPEPTPQGGKFEEYPPLRRLSPLRMVGWLAPFLTSRRVIHLTVTLAILLTLPGLWLGWQTDDHLHRATLTDEFPSMSDARRSFPDMFAFVKDGLVTEGGAIDRGELPWWTPQNFKIAFYRPTTGLTHWIDYQLWPHTPALMHVQSIAWYALTIALATVLFRRLSITPLVAGLAALIYAVSDAHGLPAVWLANRNAVLATCFGICAMLAYDRWRRDAWKPGAILAPIALLVSVLANEGAIAVGAYLVAYALFIDPNRTWRRFTALVPCTLIGVAWWAAYRAGGYGSIGSGVYIDPVSEWDKFLPALIQRAPVLFYGLFSVPPSDAHILMSQPALQVFWAIGLVVMAIIAIQMACHFRTNPVMRFATVGMLLSLIPVSATFPSDRLLMFAGIGAALIIAQLMVTARKPTSTLRSLRFTRVVGGSLVVLHLILTPLGLVTAAHNVREFGQHATHAGMHLPADPAIEDQRLIVVSTPSAFLFTFANIYAATQHRPIATETLVLGSGVYPVQVERTDANTLVVSQAGGWLLKPGRWPGDDPTQFKWVGTQYLFQTFDVLFRDEQPFRVGEQIQTSDCTIEVVELTADHRPARVRFRFKEPLEAPRYRWVYWNSDRFEPFDLPAVGQVIDLPAPRPSIN